MGEADAKQKLSIHVAEKANFLEKEIGILQGKLAKKETDNVAAVVLEVDYKQLQVHAQELSTHHKSSSSEELDLKQLLTENKIAQDEINSLHEQLADSRAEVARFMRGPGRPTPQLQEYVRGLELKLAVVELELAKSNASEAELASAKKECWALKEEIAALQVQLAGVSHSPVAMTPELVAQQQLLQSQVPLISDNCYILP